MRLARKDGLGVFPPWKAPCEGNGEPGGAGEGAFPIEVYGRLKSARGKPIRRMMEASVPRRISPWPGTETVRVHAPALYGRTT